MGRRVAVIGAGISGNTCAYMLHPDHEVTLFEAAEYVGGHTNTIRVPAYGAEYTIDTGFMVFNDRTYPNFTRLLEQLGISAQPSDMSFSVRCDRTGLEYQGSSFAGLFAQRRNLVRPSFYRLLASIVRFNREATAVRHELDDTITLRHFLHERRYAATLVDWYLLPMTAAIWSAPPACVLDMPARFLFQFFHNHGLLQIQDRPQWKTIPGGAQRYVEAMLEPLGNRVRTRAVVTRVTRSPDDVQIRINGRDEAFDQVIFACHADQALDILADATPEERDILGHFPYQRNVATVHTDQRLMPHRQAAWASWNYHIAENPDEPVAVTYDVNRLQRLQAPGPICVTLNGQNRVREDKILANINYHHPVFGPGTLRAQEAHESLNGQRRTYYCGAYWGYGFHEDGVRSALTVCRHFGKSLE